MEMKAVFKIIVIINSAITMQPYLQAKQASKTGVGEQIVMAAPLMFR